MKPLVFPTDVEGYLAPAVGQFLYDLACHVPEQGLIVELGSYKGRSTICLAQSERRVWAVDHFRGERFEAVDDQQAVRQDHLNGIYRDALEENLLRYGVDYWITVWPRSTADPPVRAGTPPISLLFIDAAHDYESVAADVAAWEPYMAPDGVMVFDDVNFPGVARAVAEAGRRGWRYLDHMLATMALRKVGK